MLSDSTQTLLEDWGFRLRQAQIGHYQSAEKFAKTHKMLGIVSICFSTLLSGILTLEFQELSKPTMKYFLIILGVLTTIVVGIQTFLASNEKAEKHKNSAIKYGELKRKVELLHMGTFSDIDIQNELHEVKKQWDMVAEAAETTSYSIRKTVAGILENELKMREYINQNK